MKRMLVLLLSFSFIPVCFSQIAVTGRVKVVEKGNEVPLPHANIVVRAKSDTTRIVTAAVAGLQGSFALAVDRGNYQMYLSFLGYVTKVMALDALHLNADSIDIGDVILEEDKLLLDEVLVEAQRTILQIDKRTVVFSKEEIQAAKEARNLLLNLPHLLIDKTSNSIASSDGKNVLVLINGLRADDSELKLIPAGKVKRVEYYDVPPIRYGTSGKVINVITDKLDAGFAGDFYVMASEFYSMATSYLSYINGRNKFTLGYSALFNPKRSVRDLYNGEYQYMLQDEAHAYAYQSRERHWSAQQSVFLQYTNYEADDYVFQIKAGLGFSDTTDEEIRNIAYSIDNVSEDKEGFLKNEVKTFSPSVDLYYSKTINEKSQLDANLVFSLFKNEQDSYSEEKGLSPFVDEMNLDNRKYTAIGELNYSTKIGTNQFRFGYRTNIASADNTLKNSLSDEKSEIKLQEHYAYGETSGRLGGKSAYRISLGGKWNKTKTSAANSDKISFIPVLILGHRINTKNAIRLIYRSTTEVPQIQQFSDNSILILSNIIRRGNSNLKNSQNHNLQLNHTFSETFLDTDVSLFYEHDRNYIFNRFNKEIINNQEYISYFSDNAKRNFKYGIESSLTVQPFNGVRLGVNARMYKHHFKPEEDMEEFSKWFFPVTLYGSYQYKNLSFNFYQKLAGKFLEGVYINGIEKVSYLNAGYSYKNLDIQLTYFFPFARNIFQSYNIDESNIRHAYEGRLKSKEKTFGISLSWQFNSSTKDYRENRRIHNEDRDSGVFNIKQQGAKPFEKGGLRILFSVLFVYLPINLLLCTAFAQSLSRKRVAWYVA